MSEQHEAMQPGAPEELLSGSTKRVVEAEPPRAWAELPLKRKIRDPFLKRYAVPLLALVIAAAMGAALLIELAMGAPEEVLGETAGLSFGAMFLLLLAWPFTRLGGKKLREVKEEELTAESYGDACVLQDVKSKARRIRLPETYRGMKLIAVQGGLAGKNRYQMVILPQGMERLEIGALSGMKQLAHVQLPGQISEVPVSLLEACPRLTAVVVPLSVTSIGSRAFANCRALRDVYLTAAVKEIAEDAFVGCREVMFHVQPGSVAERWARENGESYTYRYC